MVNCALRLGRWYSDAAACRYCRRILLILLHILNSRAELWLSCYLTAWIHILKASSNPGCCFRCSFSSSGNWGCLLIYTVVSFIDLLLFRGICLYYKRTEEKGERMQQRASGPIWTHGRCREYNAYVVRSLYPVSHFISLIPTLSRQ